MRNTYDYQKIRALERKLYLIDLRGGKCEVCGYCKNLAAFDFHHKDPSKKEHQLDTRKLSNSSMEWILNEFEKCLVVCANCHREEHNPDLIISEVRKKINEFRNSISPAKGKPKCVDCGIEINYTHERCRKCKTARSRKRPPNKEKLHREFKKYGRKWCAKKYKVAVQTIGKWIRMDSRTYSSGG